MSTEEMIMTALSPIVGTVVPIIYQGTEKEYIVFNYDTIYFYAEGTAKARRDLVQIHWFLPLKGNPNAKKKLIADAVNEAGFTYPSITNASDEKSQHYVFECECTGEV